MNVGPPDELSPVSPVFPSPKVSGQLVCLRLRQGIVWEADKELIGSKPIRCDRIRHVEGGSRVFNRIPLDAKRLRFGSKSPH